MDSTIQKETFQFNHAFRHMVNADLYLTSIINGNKVKRDAKQFVLKMKSRVDQNISDMKKILPADKAEVITNSMLNPEITLQMQNVNDMCAGLPPAILNQVESYIEQLYKVYKQN
jgi:hypothetical protein